ncbi:MAG: ABC transporter permease, partial [Mesorhizobium sp.]
MTVAAEGSPPLRMTRARRNALLRSEPVQGFA